MRRAVVVSVTALALIVGAGMAQAHPGHWRWGSRHGQPRTPMVAVAGTITSVNSAAGSFTATAFIPRGEGFGFHHGESGFPRPGGAGTGGFHRDFAAPGTTPTTSSTPAAPATTPVTITTNGSTTLRVNGRTATAADLAAGQRFVALLPGTPGESLQTLTASPALAIFAHTAPAPRQLYAFVGTVTAVSPSAGTVTVNVANSVPRGLVPAGSGPATFTVSPATLVLGGPNAGGLFGGSLSDVAVGDVVAGGLVGTAGETLSQVEASPLQVLVDFPALTAPSSTAAARRATRRQALSRAMSLFGARTPTAKKKTTHAHKARHHRRSGARTRHAGRGATRR